MSTASSGSDGDAIRQVEEYVSKLIQRENSDSSSVDSDTAKAMSISIVDTPLGMLCQICQSNEGKKVKCCNELMCIECTCKWVQMCKINNQWAHCPFCYSDSMEIDDAQANIESPSKYTDEHLLEVGSPCTIPLCRPIMDTAKFISAVSTLTSCPYAHRILCSVINAYVVRGVYQEGCIHLDGTCEMLHFRLSSNTCAYWTTGISNSVGIHSSTLWR